jgi:hypothetical protein
MILVLKFTKIWLQISSMDLSEDIAWSEKIINTNNKYNY